MIQRVQDCDRLEYVGSGTGQLGIIANPILEEAVVLDEWTTVADGRTVRYTIKGGADSGYVYGVKVDRISVGEQFTAPSLLTHSEVESRFAKFVVRIVKV